VINFNSEEKKIILLWYENVTKDFMRFGDGTVIFPNEAMLVNKLSDPDIEDFSEPEIDMINDWMETNIAGRYGNSIYLIGIEFDIYNKIKKYYGK